MLALRSLKQLTNCVTLFLCASILFGSVYLDAKPQPIEVIASNKTRNLEASSFTYASTYLHPEDDVLFSAKVAANDIGLKGPLTYIWYIPGTPAQKSENTEMSAFDHFFSALTFFRKKSGHSKVKKHKRTDKM